MTKQDWILAVFAALMILFGSISFTRGSFRSRGYQLEGDSARFWAMVTVLLGFGLGWVACFGDPEMKSALHRLLSRHP